MKIEPVTILDFPTLLPWFIARGYPDMAKVLPIWGWKASDKDGPFAAIWLYVAAPVGFMEWSVTKPGIGTKGLRGLKACIKAVKEFADTAGLHTVMQFVPNEKLVKYYERHAGFRATEKATLMVWQKGG